MYLESLSRRYRIDSVSSYKGISGLSTKGKENGGGERSRKARKVNTTPERDFEPHSATRLEDEVLNKSYKRYARQDGDGGMIYTVNEGQVREQ